MKNILLIISILLFSGCGETAKQKKERTISQLTTIATGWNGKADPPSTNGFLDAWNNPIQAKVKKGHFNYVLEVWSNGPDGLSGNHDDIVFFTKQSHGETSVNKEIEKTGASLSRGIAKGIRQGWRKGSEDEE
jgi:hypothetical protein